MTSTTLQIKALRLLLKIFKWIFITSATIAGLGYGLLQWLFSVQELEFEVLPHPTLPIELVWTESNGGATVSWSYSLWARPKGSKALDEDWLLITMKTIEGSQIQWTQTADQSATVTLSCLSEQVYNKQAQTQVRRTLVKLETHPDCPKNVTYEWSYLAPNTPMSNINPSVVGDPKLLPHLNPKRTATRTDRRLRIMLERDVQGEHIRYIISEPISP